MMSSTGNPILNARGLGKHWRGGFRQPRKTVFREVNFTVHAGETLGIMGPSGSGKTTLAEILL